MYNMAAIPLLNKYKISRRGRKLQVPEDARIIAGLPKEVPERTWAEILQMEENDLVVFDVREEILEEAMRVCYERYMERQTTCFTAHCAAEAWLKLIDWHFYRHDPGEETSAAPACFIPKREESWQPDDLPEPSPKDSWARHDLVVVEDASEEDLVRSDSHDSLEMVDVEDIPKEYWFPGKVNLPVSPITSEGKVDAISLTSPSASGSTDYAADSEMLQKVTEYSSRDLSPKESTISALKATTSVNGSVLKTTTPVNGSIHGAGDSTVMRPRKAHDRRTSKNSVNRSRMLPPLTNEPRSKTSLISDCRLRHLRLETQHEISSERNSTADSKKKLN